MSNRTNDGATPGATERVGGWPRRRMLGTAGLVGAAALATPALTARSAAAAAPIGLSAARWIWYPEGDPRVSAPVGYRYFRRTFTVAPGAVRDAQFLVTGVETVDAWLNGTPLASSARIAGSWRKALHLDLAAQIVDGANTLAIAVRNGTLGPAGLIGRLRVVTTGGTTELGTDGGWRSAATVPEGWEQPGFADASWAAALDLGAYGIAPWHREVAAPHPAGASPLRVTGRTVEHRPAGALGIDPRRPRFSWQLESRPGSQGEHSRSRSVAEASTPDATPLQGAYQVKVSTSLGDGGEVWDSGRVASAQQVDVGYAGPALASLTRYFWRLRVWDTSGRVSDWSDRQSFETGLLDPSTEWVGAFIAQASTGIDLNGATWIWYPEGDPASSVPAVTRYFRRTFDLAAAPATATLVVTGDDTADVWINGTQVSASPRVADSWRNAATVDVARQLTAGTNTIAVTAQNTSQSPAGIIAKLILAGGSTVVTDAAWKADQSGPAGWQAPGFDDSAWPAALALAGYGGGPWGTGVTVKRPAPLLRKEFTVPKPVVRARLVVTALGLYETRLNGERVGTEVLAPGWTDYGKRLQYTVHDVTSQIRRGTNAFGAWLGNGWYSGSIGFAGSQHYGTHPWYSAQLHLTYADGSTATVATDDTWKVTSSPILADDLYHGETYDARRVLTGWDQPGLRDDTWAAPALRTDPQPHLVSRVDNGATVQQEFRPVSVTQPAAGVWVFDLGQNFAGWNRLTVAGPAGTTVTMRHAEVLNPDGTIYTANLRSAQATDRFILAGTGAAETYEPRFTVHGYRYVELTGLPAGVTPTVSTVTGRAVWTTGAQLGTLTTSNNLINQLQHNIVWGERSNMVTLPTDCPQRDERLGWTGDIAIFAATATFNIDVRNFLRKFADDLVDAQQPDGAFTDVAPYVAGGPGRAGWGDAGVIVPYTIWQRYGDTRVIDDHFAAMAAWVDYLRGTSGPDLIRNQFTYGDWLNVNDNTAQDLISTAYVGWSARLVSRMAAATGRTAEATSYGRLADQVAAAFTARFVAADGTVGSNTQTGYVLALSFGLLPAALVQPAADKLAAKVAASGGHLSVGFLGVENLLPVLVDHGYPQIAYQVLLQPGFPGWGYPIANGATTIWERWDGIRTDGTFNDPGMNSFNHYGLGSVGDFLYRTVGGLAPASPGYRALRVAPRPGGGLTAAKTTYQTPYGEAISDWSIASGTLTLRVTIPAGASATVVVPTPRPSSVRYPAEAVPSAPGTFCLPAGSYTFTAAA